MLFFDLKPHNAPDGLFNVFVENCIIIYTLLAVNVLAINYTVFFFFQFTVLVDFKAAKLPGVLSFFLIPDNHMPNQIHPVRDQHRSMLCSSDMILVLIELLNVWKSYACLECLWN